MATSQIIRFLFEQSGTFKRCAQQLGFTAFDYDILNEYGETDLRIDLFEEIECAYRGEESVFDKFGKDDIVMAFFPCIRFSTLFKFELRGTANQLRGLSDLERVEHSMDRHDELNRYYRLLCQLCIVCLRRGLRLVIENPYKDNYLRYYFPISASVVYPDRRKFGDAFIKPTMFIFVGWEPHDNPVLMAFDYVQPKLIFDCAKDERSLIAPGFATYFILAHLVDFGTYLEVFNRD